MYKPRRRTPPEIRFWRKVDKSGDCWIWTGAIRSPGPYGLFYMGLLRMGESKSSEGAHRAAWLFAYGPIPPGVDVCHHCDVGACVRPAHLFLGTRADNMQDAKAKGRLSPPPRSTQKLQPADVLAIRAEQANGRPGFIKRLDKAIAARYGVSEPTVRHIRLRRQWANI